MFILLEKVRRDWGTPLYCNDTIEFETQAEAQAYADEHDLVDVAVFEFKAFT
jgi:hypothetical protein